MGNIYADIAGDITNTVNPNVFNNAYNLQAKRDAAKTVAEKEAAKKQQERIDSRTKQIMKMIDVDPTKYHPDVINAVTLGKARAIKGMLDVQESNEPNSYPKMMQIVREFQENLPQWQNASNVGFSANKAIQDKNTIVDTNDYKGLNSGDYTQWDINPLTTGINIDHATGQYQMGSPAMTVAFDKGYQQNLLQNRQAFTEKGEMMNLPFGKKAQFLTPDDNVKYGAFFNVIGNPDQFRNWIASRYKLGVFKLDEAQQILANQDKILSGEMTLNSEGRMSEKQTDPLAAKFYKDVESFMDKHNVSTRIDATPPRSSGGGGGNPIMESVDITTTPSGSFIASSFEDAQTPEQSIEKLGGSTTPLTKKGGATVTSFQLPGGYIYSHTSNDTNVLGGEKFGKPSVKIDFNPSEIYVTRYWDGNDISRVIREGKDSDLVLKKGQPITKEQYDLIKQYSKSLLGNVKEGKFVNGTATYLDEDNKTSSDNVSVPYSDALGRFISQTFERGFELPKGKAAESKGASGGKNKASTYGL